MFAFAQHQITGRVSDSKTKEPLAFVNIVANNQRTGTTTGIDGVFSLNSDAAITSLQLTYVGYEPMTLAVSGKTSINIFLKKTSYELMEFTLLPGENPAHRIIKKAVENRKINNPEKSLNFKYDSYSKMYFAVDGDSLEAMRQDTIAKLDTNDQKTIDFLDNHHLFMMESVSQRKYKLPDKSYEKVIASRVSGLKNPSFSLLANQFQSFSFYNPSISVAGEPYLNPISPGSHNKYLFLIEDTTFSGADTVFIISYRPRKGKNFSALKGLLYINTDGFALQNVIAEPATEKDGLSIKIQQQYEKIDGAWFPVQLNSNLIFKNADANGFEIMGIGKTYLKNIEINPELANKEFSYVTQEMDVNATKKDEAFWNLYREDTLSSKEQNTYHFVDSLGKVLHFDRKMKGFEALITGKLKWGAVSLDINRFMGYNDYEGFRLGAGLHTNERISKWFTIGGYGAYAFKDKEWKYGGDVDFLINKRNDVSLNFSAIKDVAEPGVNTFYDYKIPPLSSAGSRVLYLERMNNIDKLEARLKFRTLRYLKVYLFANQENVSVTNDYYFKQVLGSTVLNDQYYTFSEVGAEVRYAFKEKVIESFNTKIPTSTKYPIIYGKIAQGIKTLNGEYQYTRYALKAEKRFFIKNLGKPQFSIEAGLIQGKVPQHKLNSSIGTFRPKDFLMVATEGAFETMLPYEFFSSEYVHLHFRHSFGSLLFKTKKFQPELILTSSAGFGALSYEGLHGGTSFSTMEKGYYESGMLINNILKLNFSTFGVGAFYRYGPYQLAKASDNFTVKMSVGFAF